MPVLFKMSDDNKKQDAPTVVIAESQSAEKPRKTKKYVIIAVGSVLAAAIILTAILVGMYMFTEAEKELVKYTLNLGENTKQEVTGDPNLNIVKYHVSNKDQDTWIIDDFNKDIQVVKITTAEDTRCYVSPLNRTTAMDPSKIAKPDENNLKDGDSLRYMISNTPISDTSFLSKSARDTCAGISTYWVYPICDNDLTKYSNSTEVNGHQRQKREVCVKMCCQTYCGCYVRYSMYCSGNYCRCTWYTTPCPGRPVYYRYGC